MSESAVHGPAPSRTPGTSGTGGGEPVGPDLFKSVFRHHPAGVAVVTFATESGPGGFTATSVISVSAAPPVLAFSVAGGSSAHALLQRAPRVAVHFLTDDQADLARRFATRGVDRFSGTPWSTLPTGEPVLAEAASWVSGPILQRFGVGDSLLATVEVHSVMRGEGTRPLVYEGRTFRALGEAVEGVRSPRAAFDGTGPSADQVEGGPDRPPPGHPRTGAAEDRHDRARR